MNGGVIQPSAVTGRSLRGAETLNTPSAAFQVPGRPVMAAMRLVLSAAPALHAETANPTQSSMGISVVFMDRFCGSGALHEGEPVDVLAAFFAHVD